MGFFNNPDPLFSAYLIRTYYFSCTVDSYREPCKTSVVLGDRFAENPIEIETPIMIGAMSFGAIR